MVREGNTLGKAFERVAIDSIKNVIILENDLYNRAPSATVIAAFESLENRIVIDHIETKTTQASTLLLPSTAFSEQEATFVNYEGRAQLSFQVNDSGTSAKAAWRWLLDEESYSPEGVIKKCSEDIGDFAKLTDCLPKAGSLVAGMKVPRQSHRYSGRTAMSAKANVHEGKQAVDKDSVMSFSMEGVYPQKDASILASPWAPSWTSNQSISKFQSEINGALKQGQAGVHLLSRCNTGLRYKVEVPEKVSEGLQVVPVQHIFGSEELSGHAPPIQKRMTDAYAAISPNTASAIGVEAGNFVRFKDSEICVEVCVRVLAPDAVVLVYPGNRAAGVNFNLRDLGRFEILERVETAPAMHASSRLGLSQLLVNDLVEERG
jgi:NADH-quinone oxidoreductase subunit G